MTRLRVPPPPANETPDNLRGTTQKNLNMRVDPEFHRRLKMAASAWDMPIKDLVEQAVELWFARHGERPD